MRRGDKVPDVLGFLAGAVMGSAIGAGVALLFAPRTGKDTRKILRDKADDFGSEFDEFKKDIGPKIRKVKKEVSRKITAKRKQLT